MSADEATGQLLIYGLQDWIDLGWARQYVQHDHPTLTAVELREVTLPLIDHLLSEGLVVAGELRSDFIPWDSGPAASAARICRAWVDPDDRLRPGDIC